MLDPRIYRGALLPVLLAAIVFAFSLENRPAPAATTLAPDAFVGARAAKSMSPASVRRVFLTVMLVSTVYLILFRSAYK